MIIFFSSWFFNSEDDNVVGNFFYSVMALTLGVYGFILISRSAVDFASALDAIWPFFAGLLSKTHSFALTWRVLKKFFNYILITDWKN